MKKLIGRNLGVVAILIAALVWGCIGLFSRALGEAGFSPVQTVTVRSFFTVLFVLGFLLIKNPKALRIRPRDIWIFIGTGICSFMFFNICYMNSIEQNSLSVACILMYTSPFWVFLLSPILFKEKNTLFGFLALCIAFGGSVMVCLTSSVSLTGNGLLYGILSGFGYALYSIFGKIASKKYSSITTIFYTFLFSFIAIVPFSHPAHLVSLLAAEPSNLLLSVSISIINTILPYTLYTYGLSKVSAGKASVISIIEPVAAAVVGFLAFGEAITFVSVCGMGLVLVGLVLYEKLSRV